jgi:hypothetical protein
MPGGGGKMTIIDTNDNVAGQIPLLQSKGVTAVGRYYSSAAWKRVTQQEAQAIAAAGLKMFVVFEDNGDPPLNSDAGTHHAQLVLQQADNVGQSMGSAVYFALEHLPNGYTAQDIPGIKNYIQQIREVFQGRFKLGAYSDGVVCDALLTAGLIDYAWLSASKSFAGSQAFYASGRWALAQMTPLDQNWNGISVDVNQAQAEFGAFVPFQPPMPVGVAVSPPLAAAAMPVAFAAPPGNQFTVRHGRRYAATVVLSGIEQFASNGVIADKFTALGFRDVTASGSGGTREVQGAWMGQDTTVTLDPHLQNVHEILQAA